jgi:hypothetical protein
LTLVVVPCLFSVVEEAKERWEHRRERKKAHGGGSFAPIRWVNKTANKTPPPEL